MSLSHSYIIPRCQICYDTGWKHDPYCEVGACNWNCRPCPNGCRQRYYTPNGDEIVLGPAIVPRDPKRHALIQKLARAEMREGLYDRLPEDGK